MLNYLYSRFALTASVFVLFRYSRVLVINTRCNSSVATILVRARTRACVSFCTYHPVYVFTTGVVEYSPRLISRRIRSAWEIVRAGRKISVSRAYSFRTQKPPVVPCSRGLTRSYYARERRNSTNRDSHTFRARDPLPRWNTRYRMILCASTTITLPSRMRLVVYGRRVVFKCMHEIHTHTHSYCCGHELADS